MKLCPIDEKLREQNGNRWDAPCTDFARFGSPVLAAVGHIGVIDGAKGRLVVRKFAKRPGVGLCPCKPAAPASLDGANPALSEI